MPPRSWTEGGDGGGERGQGLNCEWAEGSAILMRAWNSSLRTANAQRMVSKVAVRQIEHFGAAPVSSSHPCEGNALQKTPMNTSSVCRLRPVLTRFVPGFPGRKRGGWRCVSIGPRRERSGHGICSRSAEVDEAARKSQAQLDERTGDSSNLIGIDADPAPAIAAEASLCRQVAFRLGKRSGILLR